MKCQSCGSENTEGKKFCSQCGVSLTPLQKKQFCTNCGKEIVPGKKFCGGCGTKISEGSANQVISKEQKTPESPMAVYHEQRKGHLGLFVLMIVLAVVLAGGGGFCIYRFIIAPSGGTSISSRIVETKDKKEDVEEEESDVSEDNEDTESNLTESSATETDSSWGGLLQETVSEQGTDTNLSAETQPVYETQYGIQGPVGAADYILPDSGSRYLTIEDLVSLTKEQLRIARNEIYAKHGRIFKTEDLNAYFLSKSWYTGTIASENFTEELLNIYEKYNVIFIQEQEDKMN